MERITGKKVTVGLLFVILLVSLFFSAGVFAADVEVNGDATVGNVVETDATTTAATSVMGVDYRGHIQDIGNYPKNEVVWVHGPDQLGTTGEFKRIEGFWIKLTGGTAIPEGASIRYNVHIENEGWQNNPDNLTDTSKWKANGEFAGSTAKSQRIEAIEIVLVGSDGKPLPGYSVKYQVHGENYGWTQGWKADGAVAGTTGESLRLEAIQIKIEQAAATAYDKAGTFGPKTGTEVVSNNVTVDADGVTLQNLHIEGDLTISEKVGDGTVNLNNVTVDGQTYVRGGGEHSIHINGGSYNNIVVEKTASGNVRIVATDAIGAAVVISEDAKGQDIILEGAFDSVDIKAPDVKVSTQGDTKIGEMNVTPEATGSEITLDKKTTVGQLAVNAPVDMKGEGTVQQADVNSNGVTFEQKPVEETVSPEVTEPPVVTPAVPETPVPTPSSGSGGYSSVAVTGIVVSAKGNATTIVNGSTLQMNTTVTPTNATNQTITWSVYNTDGTATDKATISSNGLLSAAKTGTVFVAATNDATGVSGAAEILILSADQTSVAAYIDSLTANAYQSEFHVNYAGLSDSDKVGMAGFYSDALISIDRSLMDGEEVTVNAFGKNISVTNKLVTGTEIKLSELLGLTLGTDQLAANQKGSFTIGVTDVSLKSGIRVIVKPIITKDGMDIPIVGKTSGLIINTKYMKDYFDSVDVDSWNSKIIVTYYRGLDSNVLSALAGYYSDAMIYFDRPLENGEAVIVHAFGKDITVNNSKVSGRQVKLSDLLGIKLSPDQLAVNQSGSFEITIDDVSLNSAVDLTIEPILTKGNTIVESGEYLGYQVYSTGIKAYSDSVKASKANSEFTLAYDGNLTTSQKAGLTGYYADSDIGLDRALVDGESFTLKGFGQNITVTNKNMPRQYSSLSQLMGLTLQNSNLAINKTGTDVITVTDKIIKTNLTVNLSPMLTKVGVTNVYLQNINPYVYKGANIEIAAGKNQVAPTDLKGVAPTTLGGSDGKITGTTTDMEFYQYDNWTKVTGTEIANLTSGIYQIRYAAKPTEGYNVSEPVCIVVPDITTAMTRLSATVDGNTVNGTNITGTTGNLAVVQNSFTSAITVEMDKAVTAVDGAKVMMVVGGAEVEYGTITADNSTTVTITPNGTNGTAANVGEFTFKVAADSVIDGNNNGNAETTITLTVTPEENKYSMTGTVAGKQPGEPEVVPTKATEKNVYLEADSTRFNAEKYPKVAITEFTKTAGSMPMDTPVVIRVNGENLTGLQLFGFAANSSPAGKDAWWDITNGGWGDGSMKAMTIEQIIDAIKNNTVGDFYAAGAAGTYTFRLQMIDASLGTTVLAETDDLTVTIGSDQLTPKGLVGVAPTTSANTDGMIIETTPNMEYKLKSEDSVFEPCLDTTTMVKTPGIYVVRYAEKPGYNPGATTEITVPSWNENDVGVNYQGFLDEVEGGWIDGAKLETPEQQLNFDAIRVKLSNPPADAKINYQTFYGPYKNNGIGWTAYVSDDATSGSATFDEKKNPIEAIKLHLENMANYSVIYQVYVTGRGWQDWMRDDQMAGTTGLDETIEAIRIRIVKK